jgi:hypothetical protein
MSADACCRPSQVTVMESGVDQETAVLVLAGTA